MKSTAKQPNKYVNKYQAAKSVSAYIILKKGKFVGKAQAVFGNGTCVADLWLDGYSCGIEYSEHFPNGLTVYCAQGKASGYGYDKEAAAFSQCCKQFGMPFEFRQQIESRGLRALEDLGFEVIQAI